MVFADDWHVGQVFFSMLWFFLFFIWIWLLIMVFADIFRDHKMSGWAKAAWVIFVVIVPYLGVFVYLIAGGSMAERPRPSSSRPISSSSSTCNRCPAGGAQPTNSLGSPTSRARGDHGRGIRAAEGEGARVIPSPPR